MELINDDLFYTPTDLSPNTTELTFSKEPISIGLATRKSDNGILHFIVYENNERGCRDWEKSFESFPSALLFAKTMWEGMKITYSRFDLQKHNIGTDNSFLQTIKEKKKSSGQLVAVSTKQIRQIRHQKQKKYRAEQSAAVYRNALAVTAKKKARLPQKLYQEYEKKEG